MALFLVCKVCGNRMQTGPGLPPVEKCSKCWSSNLAAESDGDDPIFEASRELGGGAKGPPPPPPPAIPPEVQELIERGFHVLGERDARREAREKVLDDAENGRREAVVVAQIKALDAFTELCRAGTAFLSARLEGVD